MSIARRKTATKAEQAYQDKAREAGCVVCRFIGKPQVGATEIHHRNLDDKHGQKQLGQHAVVALCQWHHRGVPFWGWGDDEMREEYGPSFAATPRDFRNWTDDVLPGMGRGTEAWQRYYDEGEGNG